MRSFKPSRGFTLFELALALIIAALVGFATLRQISDNATKQSGNLLGSRLNEVRKALDKYVETYRNEIILNSAIGTIPATSVAVCPQNAASTRCPTIASLVALKLLPQGYTQSGLGGARSIFICGYDATATWPATAGTNSCTPIFTGTSSCVGNACNIAGYTFYSEPFKNRGDAVTAAAFDGDSIMYILEQTEGRGAFSRVAGGNLRRQGDSAIFVPNVYSGAPSGMVAAVFGTVSNTETARPNIDFCPGRSVVIQADSNSPSTATAYDSLDTGNPKTKLGNVVFATQDPTAFPNSGNGNGNGGGGGGGSGGGGVSCSMSFVYADAPVGGSSNGSGYAVGNQANNTGVMQVTCARDSSGIAVPTFRLYSCK